MLLKLGIFPKVRDENKKCLSCHHLVKFKPFFLAGDVLWLSQINRCVFLFNPKEDFFQGQVLVVSNLGILWGLSPINTHYIGIFP